MSQKRWRQKKNHVQPYNLILHSHSAFFEQFCTHIVHFEIQGKTFEVGGKSKGKRQITDANEGYVVKDDIEYGYGNVIPIWAFG